MLYTKKSGAHLRIIDGGSGYLCEMEPVAHFGLGESGLRGKGVWGVPWALVRAVGCRALQSPLKCRAHSLSIFQVPPATGGNPTLR